MSQQRTEDGTQSSSGGRARQSEEGLDPAGRAMESGRCFEEIFRMAPNPMAVTRLRDGLILDVNEAFSLTTGYARTEALGQTTEALGLWVQPQQRSDAVAMLQAGVDIDFVPMQMRRRDGAVRWGLFSARLLARTSDEPTILSMMQDITEHRSADEALQDSARRLRQIIDLVPHFIFAKDTEGRFILVNNAVAEAYGTSVEALTGKTDAEFAASETEVHHFRADDVEVLESGRPKIIPEETITDASGRVRLLRTVKIPFTTSGTSSPAVLGVAVDITEQRQAEIALRESEERYKRLFETAGDAILIMQDNTFVDCNLTTLNLFGCTRGEIIGRRPDEFSPPSQPDGRSSTDKAAEKIRAALAGEPQRFEWIHLRRDGKPFVAEVTLNTIHFGSGPHIQAIVRDVTERRRAQAAIQRSEKKYRLLAENVTDVLWTTDLELRLTHVSPSISKVHGGTPKDWIGRPADEYLTPESVQMVRSRLGDELAQLAGPNRDINRVITLTLEQRRLDGSVFWTEVTARFVVDDHGQPVGVIGVTRDIAERRSAESQRRQLEEQLLQAQKMESVGRLAGGVAHDLNNMLTPILGYADLLRHELEPGDPRGGRAGEILVAAERCRDLVQRLLAFARKQTLEMRPLDLNELVRSFEAMLRRTLRENIAIELQLAEDLGTIEGDPGQIEQILMNLAVNAQDAMPLGGTLTIETENVPPPEAAGPETIGRSAQVRLTVRDVGMGMDKATLARLFEPFFTTKGPGAGTGLGLSTVYGIVRQHRGTLTVNSHPGKGSAFWIQFPRTEPRTAATTAALTPAAGIHGRGTVLVVEDERLVLALTSEVLRAAGYAVLEAQDGRTALEVATAHPGAIDLLLTDVILPDEDGRALHQRLSTSQPGLRVLYMSGYTADVIGRHGVLEPGVHYIQKPFATGALTAKIAELLAHS